MDEALVIEAPDQIMRGITLIRVIKESQSCGAMTLKKATVQILK